VKKDETGQKGPLLTGIIELSGEQIVYLPEGKYTAVSKKADDADRNKWRNRVRKALEPQEGIIVRTAAIHAGGDGGRDELKCLRLRYKCLLEKAAQLKAPAVLHEKSTVEAEIFRELVRLKSGTVIVDDAEALPA